jgi:hypothetical protein
MEAPDEPLLPLELILEYVLPYAFSNLAEARALCLVCRAFCDASSRPGFWCHFLLQERRGEMEALVQEKVLDEGQREGLLRCLRQRFDPRELLRWVGVEGAAATFQRGQGLALRIRQKGPGDRNCSVFCGEEDATGQRVGVGVAYFSSGNCYFGRYHQNDFDGPSNCFRWACGMRYVGAMRRNLRGGGPGRFEFADGTVFEGTLDDEAEWNCEPQRGVFSFKDFSKCEGSIQRCYAEWYATPDEEAEFPFLKVVLEKREGLRHAFVRDKRGVLEPCAESDLVPHRRWLDAFMFGYRLRQQLQQ